MGSPSYSASRNDHVLFLVSVDGALIADSVAYRPEDDQNDNEVEHVTHISAAGRLEPPCVIPSRRLGQA